MPTHHFERMVTVLTKPTSAAPFITFRFIFGLLMIFSTSRFLWLGWVEDHYLLPTFHFKYYGFEWIEVLPAFWMYAIHGLMLVGALGVALGRFYRISAILLFLTFTYTELIDLTYYLNHYYFVSLVCLLLIFVPQPDEENQIPTWVIWIFQFQIALVYIYAGFAKMNATWLIDALPLKIWLPANDKITLLGPVFAHDWTPYIFSWTGMIYDTVVVFFLLWKPTRIYAYITVVVFHVITGLLFQIGVFPIVMIGVTLLFFSPEWHRKLQDNAFGRFIQADFSKSISIPLFLKKGAFVGLMLYVIFQLAFPWRYLLYPGNLYWTEQGYRFGWRVMLMEKAGTATFYVKDSKTGREGSVMNCDFLNLHQEKQMAMQPDMILQFAHFLKDHYEANGVHDPKVRAEVHVTLNAKPSQLLIDPNIDLTKQKDTWTNKEWILPYPY